MGTGNLPDLASSPTKVDATTEQYNAITDALQGHQVMRDSNGEPVDGTYDIGTPSSGRVRKLYVTNGINVNGQDIDLSSIALQSTGVNSGASKTSGYPQYLEAGGLTGGDNVFTILGATTPLEMTIDGEGYTLETDLISDDLALAPGSNNTCLVNDSYISGDPDWSKTIGEFGYWITIDTIGSEIEALDGTIQCFSITNGSETEVFVAEIDTTNGKIMPILRGIGGTNRIAFSDNDTITLLKAHYIFLDNDLATIDTITTYPTWSASEPASPSTGDYWFDSTVKTWKRYSGASWEQLGRIYLGYAICDSADCLYVEHDDFNLAWNVLLSFTSLKKLSSNILLSGSMSVNVAGEIVVINNFTLDTSTDFIAGESLPSNQWFYVYCDKYGALYLSTTAPRKKDSRLGWYHPTEYYRCISMFFSSTNGRHNKDSNTINVSEWSAGNLTLGTDQFYASNIIPPITNNITARVQCEMTATSTFGNIYLYDQELGLVHKLFQEYSNSASVYLIKQLDLNLFQSGIAKTTTSANVASVEIRIHTVKMDF